MRILRISLVLVLFLVSCVESDLATQQVPPTEPIEKSASTELTTEPSAPTEVVQPTESPTEAPTELPTEAPLPPDPQRIEFSADDGTQLVGTYFPANNNPAPLVVLMHWAGGDKTDWEVVGMTDWLVNRGMNQGGGLFSLQKGVSDPYMFPELPENLSFGVFTFDFSGFGESGSRAGDSRTGWIQDAKAAYQIAASLPGVDPSMIAGIGASIGSDGVVDGCGEICLGALSISPGSYLTLDYGLVVKDLVDSGKKTYCVASADDFESAPECQSVEDIADRVVVYPSGGHGMMLFRPDLGLDPAIGQVVLDFIIDVFSISD